MDERITMRLDTILMDRVRNAAAEEERPVAAMLRLLVALGLAARGPDAIGALLDDETPRPSEALRQQAARPRAFHPPADHGTRPPTPHKFDPVSGTLRCKECGIPKGKHP